jgi:hypothetical protein
VDAGSQVALAHGIRRSPQWSRRAKTHLLRQPACLVCGRKGKAARLNVHHRFPFHYVVALGRPDLELDERNLFTGCCEHDEEHHCVVYHLGDFGSYCPNLEEMIALTRGLLASQIKAMPAWRQAHANRPKYLKDMTARERKAFRSMLDELMPPLAA